MRLDVRSTRNRTIIDFRGMGFGPLCVLGHYRYRKAEKDLQAHRHSKMIEICYYDKGSQVFAVNDEKYLVKGGDLFIHFPNESHGSGGYPEEKGSLYWFILNLDTGKKASGSNDLDYLLRALVKNGKRHFSGGAGIKKFLEEIFATMRSKEPAAFIRIRVRLLTQLFLLKVWEKSRSAERLPDHTRLHQVYRFIEDHLEDDLNIARLAREANFSESRFKGWFRELSGFTPMDYVQRRRVAFAVKELQRSPGLSLKDLAYSLNFSSQQYFSTVIKKFTGKTPGMLKKE